MDVIFFKTVTALAASAVPDSQTTSEQHAPKHCKQFSFFFPISCAGIKPIETANAVSLMHMNG
jgi:hypothetical protein